MSEHGGTKKPDLKVWIGAGATTAILVAGCCIGGRLIFGARESQEPLSAREYASVLAEVDTSLKAPFAGLGKDKAAYQTSADGLRAGADKLDDTVAPDAVGTLQDSLSGSLRNLADTVEQAGTGSPKCPAAEPATTILQSEDASRVRSNAVKIKTIDAAYAFGTFLPAAPKEQNRRLANGTFVKKPSGDGFGELTIESGKGGDDTLISLVDGKKPVFTVYVRAGSDHTVEDIKPGKYQIFAASGKDWNAKRKGFTRDCTFTKFDDDFVFASSGTRWTITLKEQVGGNASTSGVDPDAFPAG